MSQILVVGLRWGFHQCHNMRVSCGWIGMDKEVESLGIPQIPTSWCHFCGRAKVHDFGIEFWGMFIISYFLFAIASPCFCCWQSWLVADGWWLPQRGIKHETTSLKMASPCFSIKAAIAGRPSPLVPILESWWVGRSCYRESWHHGFVEVMWLCVVEFRFNCGSFWGEVAATPEGGRLPKEVDSRRR